MRWGVEGAQHRGDEPERGVVSRTHDLPAGVQADGDQLRGRGHGPYGGGHVLAHQPGGPGGKRAERGGGCAGERGAHEGERQHQQEPHRLGAMHPVRGPFCSDTTMPELEKE
eukprot:6929445-Pyramimonas_sp.AAC.1